MKKSNEHNLSIFGNLIGFIEMYILFENKYSCFKMKGDNNEN